MRLMFVSKIIKGNRCYINFVKYFVKIMKKMLKYLLNKGADINEMDNEGKTQLMSLIRRSLFEANKNNLLVKGPNTKNNLINVREYFNKHLDNLDIFRSLNNNGDRLVNGEKSTRILFLQKKDDNE